MKPAPPAPETGPRKAVKTRPRWLLPLVILIVSAAIFWGIPQWMPAGPVRVEFQSNQP